MAKVFISYRRDDSFAYAHAIRARLIQHLSNDQVFMDVNTIESGVDFERVIEKAVGECDVLVALIGKRWIGGEVGGASRLDNPKDYVRLEISTALARDIRVIPVLVDGATMPNMDSLPTTVQPITHRNEIEISTTRFDYDVDRLISAICKILDLLGTTTGKPDEEEEGNHSRQGYEAEAQRKAEEGYLRKTQETIKPYKKAAIYLLAALIIPLT